MKKPLTLQVTPAQQYVNADWLKHANPDATERERETHQSVKHKGAGLSKNLLLFHLRKGFLAPGTRAQCWLGRLAPAQILKASDGNNTDVGDKADPKELGFTPKPHYSKEEIKAMGLRWITAHPGGPGSEGVPLLVSGIDDEEGAYAVVGGAGNKYNFTVLRPEGGDFQRGERKPKKATPEPDISDEERQALTSKQEALEQRKKEVSEALSQRINKLIPDLDEKDMEAFRDKAREKARELLGADASDDDINEHVRNLEKAARERHNEAIQRSRNRLRHLALQHDAEIAKGGLSPDSVEIDTTEDATNEHLGQMAETYGGEAPEQRDDWERKALPTIGSIKSIAVDTVRDIADWGMELQQVQAEEKLLRRALRTGDSRTIRAAAMYARPLEEHEIDEMKLQQQLDRAKVEANTALIRTVSAKSGTRVQRSLQTGAADAAAAIASELVGATILDQRTVEQLGVAATSRVVAEYLKHKGGDTAAASQQLRKYIAEHSAATAVATMQEYDRLQARAKEMLKSADTAAGGERLLSRAQANAKKLQYEKRARDIAGRALGQLECAAQAALHLDRDSAGPMIVAGRGSKAATIEKATGLDLKRGDYRVRRGQDGWEIHVGEAAIGKLFNEQSDAAYDRDKEVARIKDDVRVNGQMVDGQPWRAKGQADGIMLKPHQQADIQMWTKQKGVLVADEVGAGKTAVATCGVTHLAEQGLVKKALVLTPLAVRDQFGDEIRKFTAPKYHDQIAVADSRKSRDEAYAGDKLFTVMTPESFARDIDKVRGAGYDCIVVDEAHKMSTRGVKEGAGSQMAKALRSMDPAYKMLMTGTPVKNDLTELHSLIEYLQPGLLGDKAEFLKRYGKLSETTGAFDKSLLRSLQRTVDGAMIGTKVRVRKDHGGKITFELDAKDASPDTQPLRMHQHTVHVDISPEQRRAYAAREKAYLEAKKQVQALRAKREPIPKRLRNATSPFMRDQDHNRTVNDLKVEDHPKVAALRDIIARHEGQTGVVFAENTYSHKTIAHGLGLKKGDYLSITGSVAGADRNVIKKVTNGEPLSAGEGKRARRLGVDPQKPPRLVLASDAANFGVNLVGAKWGVNYDAPDTYAVVEQRMGRNFRHGQDRDVHWYHIRSNTPLETAAGERLRQKEGRQLATDKLASVDESDFGKVAWHHDDGNQEVPGEAG